MRKVAAGSFAEWAHAEIVDGLTVDGWPGNPFALLLLARAVRARKGWVPMALAALRGEPWAVRAARRAAGLSAIG